MSEVEVVGESVISLVGQAIPYLWGLFIAVGVGHYFIRRVVELLTCCLHHEADFTKIPKDFPPMTRILGCIERVLFFAAFLATRWEFVGVWLGLKVASRWSEWKRSGCTYVPGKRAVPAGRSFFNIFLIGNGLSLGYSFIGALAVQIVTQPGYGVVNIAVTLVAFSLASVVSGVLLQWYIGNQRKIQREQDEKAQPTMTLE